MSDFSPLFSWETICREPFHREEAADCINHHPGGPQFGALGVILQTAVFLSRLHLCYVAVTFYPQLPRATQQLLSSLWRSHIAHHHHHTSHWMIHNICNAMQCNANYVPSVVELNFENLPCAAIYIFGGLCMVLELNLHHLASSSFPRITVMELWLFFVDFSVLT